MTGTRIPETGLAPGSDTVGSSDAAWFGHLSGQPPGGAADAPPGGGRDRARTVVAVAAAVLLGVATLGVVHYLTSSVTVTLAVDGESQLLDTRADTVADLLDDQALAVDGQDLILPLPETELTEGTVVELRYARPLTVVVDGVETVHTTTELTLGSALTAVGAPVEGSDVSLPLGRALPVSGAQVEIVTAKPVTVDVGGQRRSLISTAKTVGDLLSAEQITLSDSDTVTPALDTTITPGLTVTVTRIRIETEVRTEVIAHDTAETKDGDLTVGTRTVTTEGVDGEREVTWAVTYTNGEPTSEEQMSSTVTREPVTEQVRVGTKPAPAVDPGVSAGGAAAGLNWAALAQCESSGNPRAVNPAGYYGLYQFSLTTWASVGGTGNPVDASPAEQTKRAQILYNKAGAGQWPHCGPRLFS